MEMLDCGDAVVVVDEVDEEGVWSGKWVDLG